MPIVETIALLSFNATMLGRPRVSLASPDELPVTRSAVSVDKFYYPNSTTFSLSTEFHVPNIIVDFTAESLDLFDKAFDDDFFPDVQPVLRSDVKLSRGDYDHILFEDE